MARKREKQKEEKLREEIEELKRKIRKLEEEKAVREESKETREESIVGSFVGAIIPGLGKIVKTLEKTSPEFRERIEETDRQIKSNLAKGIPRRTHIEYGYSIRPLARPLAEGEERRGFVTKKAKEEPSVMLIWERTPTVEREDIKIYPRGRKLIIEIKGKLYKEIVLPFYVKKIEAKYEKGKKEGVLGIKVEKR